MSTPLTLIGRGNWRDRDRLFGMHHRDRFQHLYVVGQTGTGKTTLLQNLIWQDLKNDHGLCFLDPHGDAVEELVRSFPEERRDDLVYLDVPSASLGLGFNPLEQVPLEQRALAASGIVEAFRNVWTGTAWGPRLEHILRNALLTLLDQKQATLADLSILFHDKEFRGAALRRVTHPAVREFWEREFAAYPARYRTEALAPIWNKLGAFLAQPPLYRVLTRTPSGLRLREVMDQGKVLLVNLAKGKIGGDGANLLGSLLVSGIGLSGLSRADVPEEQRRPFFMFLDEFHSFTTRAFADQLSEMRKYRLGMTLAHQYMGQLDAEVCDAILGNAGSLVLFRVGAEDSGVLGRQFHPEFDQLDMQRLANHDCYVRLLVQGESTFPFSARTLGPIWRAS